MKLNAHRSASSEPTGVTHVCGAVPTPHFRLRSRVRVYQPPILGSCPTAKVTARGAHHASGSRNHAQSRTGEWQERSYVNHAFGDAILRFVGPRESWPSVEARACLFDGWRRMEYLDSREVYVSQVLDQNVKVTCRSDSCTLRLGTFSGCRRRVLNQQQKV